MKIRGVKFEFYFLENFVLDNTVILNFRKIRTVKKHISSQAENEFVFILPKFGVVWWRNCWAHRARGFDSR